jgi:hypothetical protein
MSDEHSTDLLSALPRTRPHRRSDKRGARPPGTAAQKAAAPKPQQAGPPKPKASSPARGHGASPKPRRRPSNQRLRQPAQPRGIPSARRARERKPAPATGVELVGTAVQAATELAEIGFAVGVRALRNAVGRLPLP